MEGRWWFLLSWSTRSPQTDAGFAALIEIVASDGPEGQQQKSKKCRDAGVEEVTE